MSETGDGGTPGGAAALFAFGWPVGVLLLLLGTPAGMAIVFGIFFSGIPIFLLVGTGAICGVAVHVLPLRWSVGFRMLISFPLGVAAGLLFLLSAIVIVSGGQRMGMLGTWESLASQRYWSSVGAAVLITSGLVSSVMTGILLASRRSAKHRAERYVQTRSADLDSKRSEAERAPGRSPTDRRDG